MCFCVYFWDCECWAPLLFEYVETDASLGVDVGVIDSRLEHDFRRLEGVVRREGDAHEEHTSGIRAVSWTHDGSLKHVIWRQSRGRKEAKRRPKHVLASWTSHPQRVRHCTRSVGRVGGPTKNTRKMRTKTDGVLVAPFGFFSKPFEYAFWRVVSKGFGLNAANVRYGEFKVFLKSSLQMNWDGGNSNKEWNNTML